MPKPSPFVLLCFMLCVVIVQGVVREVARADQEKIFLAEIKRIDLRCNAIEKNMRTSVIHPRFFKHCLDCKQCGTPSPESSLCEEGFELFKSDLREGKK